MERRGPSYNRYFGISRRMEKRSRPPAVDKRRRDPHPSTCPPEHGADRVWSEASGRGASTPETRTLSKPGHWPACVATRSDGFCAAVPCVRKRVRSKRCSAVRVPIVRRRGFTPGGVPAKDRLHDDHRAVVAIPPPVSRGFCGRGMCRDPPARHDRPTTNGGLPIQRLATWPMVPKTYPKELDRRRPIDGAGEWLRCRGPLNDRSGT